jgi:coatomer protein complex subunit epsilon
MRMFCLLGLWGQSVKKEGEANSWRSVALIVQIHLRQNRTDLATKEAHSARKWAQDSLLVNLAESWIGMREVHSFISIPNTQSTDRRTQGGEKYQSAFYVFEELAQTSQSQSSHSLVAQAVSELHLGRLPEAEAALEQAMALHDNNADTIANSIVLHILLGKREEAQKLKGQLESVDAQHRVLVDWKEKKGEFAKAASKYTPKFEVAA